MKCWFCEEEKELQLTAPCLPLAYGTPFPIVQLKLEGGNMKLDGEMIYILCNSCRMAILKTIAESGVASKENVLKTRKE
jgi:hypothetical protein